MLAGFLRANPLFCWAEVGCGGPRWPRTVRTGRGARASWLHSPKPVFLAAVRG
jgi:hypothetical protein